MGLFSITYYYHIKRKLSCGATAKRNDALNLAIISSEIYFEGADKGLSNSVPGAVIRNYYHNYDQLISR